MYRKAYIKPEFELLQLASADEILASFEDKVDENTPIPDDGKLPGEWD